MMKRMIIGAFLLSALACESKPAEAPAVAPAEPPKKAAVVKAPVEAPITDSEIPVVADFEADAETAITKANYAKELDAIAASMDADD